MIAHYMPAALMLVALVSASIRRGPGGVELVAPVTTAYLAAWCAFYGVAPLAWPRHDGAGLVSQLDIAVHAWAAWRIGIGLAVAGRWWGARR